MPTNRQVDVKSIVNATDESSISERLAPYDGKLIVIAQPPQGTDNDMVREYRPHFLAVDIVGRIRIVQNRPYVLGQLRLEAGQNVEQEPMSILVIPYYTFRLILALQCLEQFSQVVARLGKQRPRSSK